MANATSTITPKRIWLLTHPRTASNLLVRILNLQHQPALRAPDADTRSADDYEYFFISTVPLRIKLANRASEDWSQDEYAEMAQLLQSSADQLRTHVDNAKGRLVFVEEHLMWMLSPEAEDLAKGTTDNRSSFWKAQFPQPTVHCEDSAMSWQIRNDTIFPDSFLRTWIPTFMIRHPALVFPSLYRTSVDLEGPEDARKNANGMFRLEMTWRWSRSLYQWYNREWEQGSTTSPPVIIDADDIILRPEIVLKYCELVGLESDKCRFQWEHASIEEEDGMNFIERRMKSSLLSSSGILQQGKVAAGLEIQAEAHKWKGEFGEEEAKKIEKWVAAAMPDYEFLKERRLAM